MQRMATKKTPGRKRPAQSSTPVTAPVQTFPATVTEAMRGLTVQERKFVQLYCGRARGNGTLAVQLSGMTGAYATQATRASILLARQDIRNAIDAWMTAYAMNAAEITWRITDLAGVNPGPFFEVNAEGKLALKATMTADEWEEYKHWVKEVETDPKTGQVTRLQLHDPVQALRELAKIRKLYSDNVIVQFNMQVQSMSDEELIRQLQLARAEVDMSHHRLPSGPPVAVIDHPQEGSK